MMSMAMSMKRPRRSKGRFIGIGFSLNGSLLRSHPPSAKRRAGPRRDVTTVDQSDIRVLINALYDPSGASSLYRAGIHTSKGWAQGCDEGSPDPYTRRGPARRFDVLEPYFFGISSRL